MQRLVALAKELGRKDRDHAKLGPLLRPPPEPAGPPPGAAGPPPTEQGTGVPLQMPPGPGRLPPGRAIGPGRLPPGRAMAAGRLPPGRAIGPGRLPPGRAMAAGRLPPGPPMRLPPGPPMRPPPKPPFNLHAKLTTEPPLPTIGEQALEELRKRAGLKPEFIQPSLRPQIRDTYRNRLERGLGEGLGSQIDIIPSATGGGLIDLAAGGEFSGRVPGEGGGMEDNVRMPIKEGNKQVATLAVSPTEYVVDSHTMAALGNGNPDEGADVMDEAVKQIRRKAYGTNKQPTEISGLAALKPLVDKVG